MGCLAGEDEQRKGVAEEVRFAVFKGLAIHATSGSLSLLIIQGLAL
jgi:hypothetical protein